MRSLVTGGAGFIGSHLIDRLVKRGDEVIVLDNVSSGKEEFLSHHSSQVTLHRVDITDYDAMSPYFEGVDVVFHFAANPDIRLGTQVTDTDLKQGTLATYNVVESMRVHSVPTIMFAPQPPEISNWSFGLSSSKYSRSTVPSAIFGNGFTFTKVVCEPTHKLASDPLTEKVVDMVGETEILELPATAFHE